MPESNKPLVFVSHDARDAAIAEAFGRLIASISAGFITTFVSSSNLRYGGNWYTEIMDALDAASEVICLLTKNSLNRPWILFEAGAAKGSKNKKVTGLALGVSRDEAFDGPFAIFQNCEDDDDKIVRFLLGIVKNASGEEPDHEIVTICVKNFRRSIEQHLTAIDRNSRPSSKSGPSTSPASNPFSNSRSPFDDFPYSYFRDFIQASSSILPLNTLEKMYGGRYKMCFFSDWAASHGSPILECVVDIKAGGGGLSWNRESIDEADWKGVFLPLAGGEVLVVERSLDDPRDCMFTIIFERQETPAARLFGMNISYQHRMGCVRVRTAALERIPDDSRAFARTLAVEDVSDFARSMLVNGGRVKFKEFRKRSNDLIEGIMVLVSRKMLE